MKGMNKRSKIIVGSAGLVLVLALIVAAVFALPGGGKISGATIIEINPSTALQKSIDEG